MKGGSFGGLGFDNARRWRAERSAENVWLTPQWVLRLVRRAFDGRIDFDPCSTAANPCEAAEFVCEPEDGLLATWRGNVWCNPPFSASTLVRWVDKAHLEAGRGCRVLILLPSRPETNYGQAALAAADHVHFFSERIAFEGMTRHSAIPCTLFAFNVGLESFAGTGVTLRCREAA